MKNLVGLKWKELAESEKQNLYMVAYVDRDNVDAKTGECIVDFGEDLAISGVVIYGEDQDIIIDDNSILYNPIA